MTGLLAVAALLVSTLLLAGMVGVLVMLRKGDGPTYSASRAYDANRREAWRALTGQAVEAVPSVQRRRGRHAVDDPGLERRFAAAAIEALEAIVPADRGLETSDDGVRLRAERVRVVPAVSTASLRDGRLDGPPGDRLTVGLVLFDPEPPGGEATRVTLPIQALFPALEEAGRDDLVARFEDLARAAPGAVRGATALAGALLVTLVAAGCGASDAPADEAAPAEALQVEAAAPDTTAIEEWTVPWPDTRPRDPYVAPDGRIWFVGQRGDYVAVFDPASEAFGRRYDLPEGAGPHNVVVSGQGTPWYAGNRAAHVGRVDPETGAVETVPMPDPAARDPHTLAFGPEGAIWFTVQGGNRVGRLEPATGTVDLVEVPTPSARPYGLVVAPDGRPWLTEFGSNKLAVVDPASMELREVVLPREGARPRRLGATSDGAIWYVDYAEGRLGRLDPATGEIAEWPAPGGRDAQPYAMAIDDRDRPWFVETGPDPNRLVGFDPATETFLPPTPIPSGGGTVRHMVFDPETRSIWFGTDAGTIGRATLPE